MKVRLSCFLCGLILLLLPAGEVFAQEGLSVDAAQNLGLISPFSYGVNHGPWAVVPLALLPQAEAAGVTFIRFPGGNWGDLNSIVPRQIDEFIERCQQMGAVPSITVRLKDGTPEAAAELVRYTNLEKNYHVRYWSIGNEPNLFDDYTTEQFNQEWRVIAEAMLAVDPAILLVGPDISQYPPILASTPKDANGRDWMEEFLKANSDLVDIVSIHRYPFPRNKIEPTTLEELRGNPSEWDVIIPNLRGVIQATVGHELPIAVTEVNSHWSGSVFGEASPDSFYSAIWYADVLGRLISQQVDIVAYFTLQSPNQYGGWGLLASSAVRPTYYVFQLYQHFGQTLVYAESTIDELSIYAARRDDGALTVIVINLGAEEKTTSLHVDNFTSSGVAEMWRFDADHNAELLGSQALEETITLPAQSITLYVVD